jgi:hypothetical protein
MHFSALDFVRDFPLLARRGHSSESASRSVHVAAFRTRPALSKWHAPNRTLLGHNKPTRKPTAVPTRSSARAVLLTLENGRQQGCLRVQAVPAALPNSHLRHFATEKKSSRCSTTTTTCPPGEPSWGFSGILQRVMQCITIPIVPMQRAKYCPMLVAKGCRQ